MIVDEKWHPFNPSSLHLIIPSFDLLFLTLDVNNQEKHGGGALEESQRLNEVGVTSRTKFCWISINWSKPKMIITPEAPKVFLAGAKLWTSESLCSSLTRWLWLIFRAALIFGTSFYSQPFLQALNHSALGCVMPAVASTHEKFCDGEPHWRKTFRCFRNDETKQSFRQ